MKLLYKPTIYFIIADAIAILLIFGIVLGWLPLTTQTPFLKYNNLLVVYFFTWIISSYFFKRYKKNQGYTKTVFRLLYTAVVTFLFLWALIELFYTRQNFSERVLLTITVGIFTLDYLMIFIYYAFRYAVSYETPEEIKDTAKREKADEIQSKELSGEEYRDLRCKIEKNSGNNVLDFMEKSFDLQKGSTNVLYEYDKNEIKAVGNYSYSTFAFLKRLNDIRGVNVLFYQLNEKLPDNGKIVCCFESKSTRKKIILNKYPKYINYIVYTGFYIVKRLIPHIFLTRRLYYDVTNGKKRVLSKAEVLGRLYYAGFAVVADKKIGNLTYVIAQRVSPPQPFEQKTYGPLIRLPRVGKDGKKFNVYKFRTMHPFSEYLQPYIFEKNSLQEGGKINKDIRVTTLGRFMRKYWLDELPMIINLLKGDMKLIGVRPLSQHYFSLYSKELQEERTKSKPGLLPPFYADMPKTLDEIQESEMRYLKACKEKGTFATDVRYFFLILKNILFKKARSA